MSEQNPTNLTTDEEQVVEELIDAARAVQDAPPAPLTMDALAHFTDHRAAFLIPVDKEEGGTELVPAPPEAVMVGISIGIEFLKRRISSDG